ncbi:LuxR C-terminal-related transcriptional regulator [Arthrobacter sp. MYb213]|uniref:helix-turn-helix domain-containing protein n=1 Tax=Arthrobacter sp. MYb213 TaxID=1848595 RepID=UPI000CFAE718|nr:LuxR C-terminal-related transcriptional regulator [Arthrobacter sp. MYb213]PRB70279.1 hypothetical protein CQ011_08960 [Arthrobacter sp. MYb213]
MSLHPNQHPAFARFSKWADSSSRLLLVKAAAGTGRGWFARSWIAKRHGEVHDWTRKAFNEASQIDSLVQRLDSDPDLHLAIILKPTHLIWSMPWPNLILIAHQQDLLLTRAEIAELVPVDAKLSFDRSLEIFEQCGGWLAAAKLLTQDAEATQPALQAVRSGLAMWLKTTDPNGELSEAVCLSIFDEDIVEAFFGEISEHPHGIKQLVDAGLLCPNGDEAWMMPEMFRQALTERVSLSGPERMKILEKALTRASIEVYGIRETAETLARDRKWVMLLRLLVDNWIELFLENPAELAGLVKQIPPFITSQKSYAWLAFRLLITSIEGGTETKLPGFTPDYSTDQVAHKLREDTAYLYRKPNNRALTVGLLEVVYLRSRGMYVEAGAAAIRMHDVLRLAINSDQTNPILVAMAQLQTGITLLVAGEQVAARQALEMSFAAASALDHPFLLANSAGKIAMLNVLEGDFAAAKLFLIRHDRAIARTTWGRPMLARAAELSRSYLSLTELDLDTSRQELRNIPEKPDADEFWAVHAYLLAMHKTQDGLPEAAGRLISTIRQQRHNAAQAPLSRKLLDDAAYVASMLERTYLPPAVDPNNVDPVLVALRYLRDGQPDSALAVLQMPRSVTEIRSHGNLGAYLKLIAQNPDLPISKLQEQISRMHHDSGSLSELSMLMLIPGWGEVAEIIKLDQSSKVILQDVKEDSGAPTHRRPSLTPREREILAQLRSGMSRREIAEETFRSENTVKAQMRSLYRKLESNDLEQMLEQARLWGL